MGRRLLASAAIVVVGVLGTAGAAFANDCVNLTRPHNQSVPGDIKGRWVAFDEPFLGGETWVFSAPDNFMNGQDDAILGNAKCPGARLAGQSGDAAPEPGNLNGIWSEECFDKAISDLP